MRILFFFIAAVCACGQTLPPLFDLQNTIDWITKPQLSQVYVDAAGDVYFAGNLPPGSSVPATYRLGSSGDWDIIVFKLDARMEQIRYITVIGGSGSDTLTGMQVDSEGHVFLSGTSHSADFPVTKRMPGALDNYGGFMLRLSPTGSTVDYSVLMPMASSALALGSDGGVYVGGSTYSGQLQATPAAFLAQPPRAVGNYGYVLKLRAADGEVEFATWLPQQFLKWMAARRGGGVAFIADTTFAALNSAGSQLDFTAALKSSLSLLTADTTGNFYVYEPTSDVNAPINRLTKYSPQGAVMQTTDIKPGFSGSEIAVSADGTAYVWGGALVSFPTRNSLERCYANRPGSQYGDYGAGAAMVAVSPVGAITYSGFISAGFQALALAPGGRYLYGPAGGLGPWSLSGVVRLDMQQIPTTARVSPGCLANGASYNSGRVTPGEIMTIYGSGIGPDKGVSFGLVDGKVPTQLAGVSVTVGGVPAPMLYTQDAQINFIVPWGTFPAGTTQVCVTRSGDQVCMESWVGGMDVAVFGDAAGPIVVLPDGTRTTSVPAGGYFTLYVTGTGPMDSPVDDGGVSGFPLRNVRAQGHASFTGPPVCAPMGCRTFSTEGQISYAGNSPGLVWGVTQINIKVPDLVGGYAMTLSFPGSQSTPTIGLNVYRPQ